MFAVFLLFASIGLIPGASTHAQESNPNAQPAQEIGQAWLIRHKIKSEKDPIAENQLITLLDLQKKHGLVSIPSIANLLLQEGLRENIEVREKKIQYARLFSGNSSLVDHFLCTSGFNLRSVKACVEGYKKDFATSEGRLRIFSNASTVFLGAFSILALTLGFLFMINHWKTSMNHLSYVFPSFPLVGLNVMAILFLLTCYVGFGFPGLLYGTAIFFCRYLHFQEKILVTVFAMVIFFIPSLFRSYALTANYNLGITHILESPFEDFDVSNKIIKLENHLKIHPQDHLAIFTLARLHGKMRNSEKSEELFHKSASLQPKWHKPWIHLSILQHQKGETDGAVESLKKAIQLNPNSVYAHFNLSKLLIKETRLEEAQAELKKAKEIDRELFESLETGSNNSSQGILIEEGLDKSELYELTHPKFSRQIGEVEDALFRYYFRGLSKTAFYLLAFLLATMPWLIQKTLPLPSTFTNSSRSSFSSDVPQQLDILNPISVKKAFGNFGLFSSLWEKMKEGWITFLIPGSHFYFQGHQLLCAFLLLVLSLLLSPLLTHSFLLENIRIFPNPGASPLIYASSIIFAVVYGLLGYSAVRNTYGS